MAKFYQIIYKDYKEQVQNWDMAVDTVVASKSWAVLSSSYLPLQLSKANIMCAWANFLCTHKKHIFR
jgi:hypothetical protein